MADPWTPAGRADVAALLAALTSLDAHIVAMTAAVQQLNSSIVGGINVHIL